jgi:hypothetical protein
MHGSLLSQVPEKITVGTTGFLQSVRQHGKPRGVEVTARQGPLLVDGSSQTNDGVRQPRRLALDRAEWKVTKDVTQQARLDLLFDGPSGWLVGSLGDGRNDGFPHVSGRKG